MAKLVAKSVVLTDKAVASSVIENAKYKAAMVKMLETNKVVKMPIDFKFDKEDVAQKELNGAIEAYKSDEYSTALKNEAMQKGAQAIMKMAGAAAISTIPLYEDCVNIFDKMCNSKIDDKVKSTCDVLNSNSGLLDIMLR